MDGGKKVRMKLMPNFYTVRGCSLKTAALKYRFDARNV
jgi:hypothetical protein